MSLAANALITLAEFKGFLGIDAGDTDTDTLNEKVIDSASQQIEKYTGRQWITPGEAADEIFSGNGKEGIYSVNVPIVAISSLSYRSGSDGSDWTSVTSDWVYANDAAAGRIYFTDGNIFEDGFQNWKLSYTYGYAITAIPPDMKMACAFIAALIKKQFESQIIGVSAKSFGDQTTTYNIALTPMVKDLLAQYRRITA